MAIFSIWEVDGCDITLKRGEGAPMYADGRMMDPGNILVKVFEATSWNEARQVQADHYGWGRYKPHDGWEEIAAEDGTDVD